MPKPKQSYFKPSFDFNRDLFEGVTWPVANSKGTGTYSVTLEPKGFTCDCPGFAFRGKCKHAQQTHRRLEEAINGEAPEYHTY